MLENLTNKKEISKFVYWLLVDKNFKSESSESCRIRWEVELGIQIEKEVWEKLRMDNYYITLSTNLRYFQFRVYAKKLVTNYHRNKWDKEISPLCEFCKVCTETVLHVLVNCEFVKKLWKAIEKWVSYMYGENVILTEEVIILNNYRSKSDKKLINTIILICKQYIYACKCCKKPIEIMEAIRRVHNMYLLEKQIAREEGKMEYHVRKWKKYINTL